MSRALLLALILCPAAAVAHAEAPLTFLLSWGSQGHADNQFQYPTDVCVNSSGHVFVADYHHHTVKKFDANGNFLQRIGSPGYGFGGFDGCWSVAVDASDYLYVSDAGNDLVQKFSPSGVFLQQWRLPAPTATTTDQVIALDVTPAGDVFVTDMMNNVHRFTSTGTFVRTWSIGDTPGTTTGFLPEVAAAPDGGAYAWDATTGTIRRFDALGQPLGVFPAAGAPDGRPGGATGMEVDLQGTLWTAAGYDVRHFDGSGVFLSLFGSQGNGPGQFRGVWGIAVTPEGIVYAVDRENHRIEKFGPAPTPVQQTSWGRLKSIYR